MRQVFALKYKEPTARLSVAFVFADSLESACKLLAAEANLNPADFRRIYENRPHIFESVSVVPLRNPDRGKMTIAALRDDAQLRQLEEHVIWLGPWFVRAEQAMIDPLAELPRSDRTEP